MLVSGILAATLSGFSLSGTTVEAAAGDVALAFPKPDGVPIGALDHMAFDGSVLWAADWHGILYKLDPSDGHLLGTLDVGTVCSSIQGLGWDGTRLWLAGGTDQAIHAIDPATGQMIRSFSIPGTIYPSGISFGGGVLWVMGAVGAGGTIYKLNPEDGSLLGTITVPAGVLKYCRELEYFNGALWMVLNGWDWDTGSEAGWVYKLDPADGALLWSHNTSEVWRPGLAANRQGAPQRAAAW